MSRWIKELESRGLVRVAPNVIADENSLKPWPRSGGPDLISPLSELCTKMHGARADFLAVSSLAQLLVPVRVVLYAAEDRELVASLARFLDYGVVVFDDVLSRFEAVLDPFNSGAHYVYSRNLDGLSVLANESLLVDFSGKFFSNDYGFVATASYRDAGTIVSEGSGERAVLVPTLDVAAHFVLTNQRERFESDGLFAKSGSRRLQQSKAWLVWSPEKPELLILLRTISINLERVFRFLVATYVFESAQTQKLVEKKPLLAGRWSQLGCFRTVPCSWEWVEGESFDEVLIKLIETKEGMAGIAGIIHDWYLTLDGCMKAGNTNHYFDAIWQNSIVSGDGFKFIDLEWSVSGVCTDYLLFRAIYRSTDAKIMDWAAAFPRWSIYSFFCHQLRFSGRCCSVTQIWRFVLQEARFTSAAQGRNRHFVALLLVFNVFVPFGIKRQLLGFGNGGLCGELFRLLKGVRLFRK